MLINLDLSSSMDSALHKVLESSSDIVAVADKDGFFIRVNQAVSEVLGYTVEEITGHKYSEFLSPEYLDVSEEARLNILEGQKVIDFENCYIHKKGYVVHISWSACLSPDDNMIYGIGRDITGRKTAEEKTWESTKKYQTLFEQASDAIMITDFKGNFMDVNTSLCKMFGYQADELLKMNVSDLLEPVQLEQRPIRFDMIKEGQHMFNERDMLHRDGSIIHVEANVKKFSDECIVAIARDITERKKIEVAISQSRYMLKERVKELTTLYKSGQILQNENLSIPEALEQITGILCEGWQFSEIAEGRIVYGTQAFTTEKYRETTWKQEASFITSDGVDGLIDVVYLQETTVEAEGPFLAEERNLINMLAEMIRIYINRRNESEALQKSEANLKTIFDTTETVYAMTDEKLKIISYNHAALRFAKHELGIEAPENINLSAYFRSDRMGTIGLMIPAVLAGKPIHYEADYLQPDGSVHWYDVRLNPIKDDDHQLIGIMLSMDNISERKIQEEYANRQIQLLKELSYITSHELRHEYVKLHGVVNLLIDLDNVDKEIKDIVNNSRVIFDNLNESIIKLNDKIVFGGQG